MTRAKQTIGVDGVLRAPEAEAELNLLAARVFRTRDGQKLLAYLKSITINAVMGDRIETNALVHREGQRFIVGLLDRRIEHGRSTARSRPSPEQPAAGE